MGSTVGSGRSFYIHHSVLIGSEAGPPLGRGERDGRAGPADTQVFRAQRQLGRLASETCVI